MSFPVVNRFIWPDSAYLRVVWLTFALFLSYLCVAMTLPVTPVYVATELGFGNALAGLAVGIAFASTILTRGMAGRMCDCQGSKRCMTRGLWIYSTAALVCLTASWHGLSAPIAYLVLLAGRLLLGIGESMATVGLIAWALGIMGPKRSGLVFGLVGMGLYGAFAVGGPIGLALLGWAGFQGVMAASFVVPLVGIAMVSVVAAVAPQSGERIPFWRIVGMIWQPGFVIGLQGVGFAAIGAFLPLFFLHQGWANAGLGLTCFGSAFVLVRLFLGHLPDRLGAIPVALGSLAVEIAGQLLLWTATTPTAALLGAFLTGLGCSLMFPSMGIEVVGRVPPHLRGSATGGFAAFQDLAYGLTGPTAGLLADSLGYNSVFLIGGLSAFTAVILVLVMSRQNPQPSR